MGLRRSTTAKRGGLVSDTPHVEASSIISIIDACTDQELFGGWFKDRVSWASWFCFLKAMFALPLDDAELALFQQCTGRSAPSLLGYLEVSLIIGRRGGKSLILALIAVYLACFYNWRPYLTGGERGSIVVVATDRRQAGVILRYIKAFLAIPALVGMIERETADTIDLNNLVTIEIQTASFRTIRGRTILASLCDELAFWSDENSANPDTEIIAALRPAMATIPKAMFLKASSPHAKRGALWGDFKRHFGRDDSSVLVWQCDTKTMNPSVPQAVIDAAYENDPADAGAEYGGLFRSDLEQFVAREAVEACVIDGRFELPPMAGVVYSAFVDPSGGSNDSMTLAICHREGERAVLDAIREVRPPFSPEAVVAEFATLLKTYRIHTVIGDRYAGLWPRERFQVHGVTYSAAAKPKSDLYRDLLPIVNGARCELLDHPKLVAQLCALERRTWRGGRDSIDHPPNQHDDIINACAGALTSLIGAIEATPPRFGIQTTTGGGWNGSYHVDGSGNASAGEVYASAPPEYWAARGIFHKNDEAYWIRKAVWKPPTEGPKQ
jgi:hypothetical protein